MLLILSEIAVYGAHVVFFQAIEKGYTVNYDTFNTYEIEKFGALLSDLFLREWDNSVKTQNSSRDIQHHFLEWPPLMHYVKIYGKFLQHIPQLTLYLVNMFFYHHL